MDCIEHYIDETGVRLCPICKFPYSIRYVRRLVSQLLCKVSRSVRGVSRSTNHITMEIANSHRYSIREGILIYNQNDLKMIWIRLFALLLVGSTMLPLISFSLTELLKIARQDEPNYYYSLFQTTSMTFLFYTVLLCSVKFIKIHKKEFNLPTFSLSRFMSWSAPP